MGFSHLGVGVLMIPHLGGDNPWYRAGNAPNPVGAYQARGVDSYTASLVNLANPGTYNLVESNGVVTWDAVNGWQFAAASTQALNTGIVNGQGWTAIVQYAAAAAVDGYFCGVYTASNTRLGLGFRFAANTTRYMNGNTLDVAPRMAAGNVAVAGQQGYRNGIANGGTIGAWSGAANKTIYIGALNNNSSIEGFLTGNIYAIAIYNLTLTPSQVLAVATAMAAL